MAGKAGNVQHRARAGASLFAVLLMGAALTIVALAAFLVTNQFSNRTTGNRNTVSAFQIADGAAEYIRLKIMEQRSSVATIYADDTAWVQAVANNTFFNSATTPLQFRPFLVLSNRPTVASKKVLPSNACNTTGNPTAADVSSYSQLASGSTRVPAVDSTCLIDLTSWARYTGSNGSNTAADSGKVKIRSVYARIVPIYSIGTGVTPGPTTVQDLEIRVTAALQAPCEYTSSNSCTSNGDVNGAEQTVIRGITASNSVGSAKPLYAMASRTINCAFCHLRVNGDIATIEHLRPGKAKDACIDIGSIKGALDCTSSQVNGDGTGDFDATDSIVNGDVRAYSTITDDAKGATDINSVLLNAFGSTQAGTRDGTAQNSLGTSDVKKGSEASTAFLGDSSNPGLVVRGTDVNQNGNNNDDLKPISKSTLESQYNTTNTSIKVKGKELPESINIEDDNAKGSIYVIPPGKKYEQGSNVSSLTQKTTGTVVLVGTKSDPIDCTAKLDSYITGDLIIKGYVNGQCSIYSGRNTYIAGEIIYKDNIDSTISNRIAGDAYGSFEGKSRDDALIQAKRDNETLKGKDTGKSSLVLGAVGNVVLGDYTNKKSDGTTYSVADRASEDFMRAQFGLRQYCGVGTGGGPTACSSRYYDKTLNEEVIPSKTNPGSFITLSGAPASTQSPEVLFDTTKPTAYDADKIYDPIFKPGAYESNGKFSQTVSDDQYRAILGQQNIKDDTVRIDTNAGLIPTKGVGCNNDLCSLNALVNYANNNKNDKGAAAAVKDYLQGIYSKSSDFQKSETLNAAVNAAYNQIANKSSTWNPASNSNYNADLGIMKLVLSGTSANVNQIERLDAFVYTNGRLGGKVSSGTNLMVNGGFQARDFGVLAAGAKDKNTWVGLSTPANRDLKYTISYNQVDCFAGDAKATGTPETNAYCNGYEKGIGMSINYDYRLTLLSGTTPPDGSGVGTVIYFRVGEPADRVVKIIK